jgi:hypothetical protein
MPGLKERTRDVILLPVIALAVSPFITSQFVHLKPRESVDRLLYWNLAVTAVVWIALYLAVLYVSTWWEMKHEWSASDHTNEQNIYVECGPKVELPVHTMKCVLRHLGSGAAKTFEERPIGGVLGPPGWVASGFNYPGLPLPGEYEATWTFCERENGKWIDAARHRFSYRPNREATRRAL